MNIQRITRVIALLCAILSASLLWLAYRANEDRWHQGPTVVVLSPSHGLHEMDVLFIAAATGCAAIALIAMLIARR